MTPKERAKELVQKFREGIYKDIITDDYSTSTERIRNRRGKDCALIAANEIIGGLSEINNMESFNVSKYTEHWIGVKAEIEKL